MAKSDETERASEPLPQCDALRAPEQISVVDPRYASRAVLDPRLGARPMTLEDHWQDIAALALHDEVPNLIRVHFETARNLLLYSWFAHRFQQVAEMHAYASVEYALRKRAGLPLRGRKPGLRFLLRQAVEEGWIRDEGFRRFREVADRRAEYEEMEAVVTGTELDPNRRSEEWSYVRTLADLLPEFRNKLAHGSAMLAPSGKRTLALCCDLINQLFPTDGGELAK